MGIPQDGTAVEGKRELSKTKNITFAKLLAENDKKLRDKGLKKLQRWLSSHSLANYEFTEDEFMTIWIGLFYSMWMSDLPLVQEELAEALSSLIHCFNKNDNSAILFIKCFNAVTSQSWLSLDQYRVDKFSMLIRRFLRQSLTWLSKIEWNAASLQSLMDVYEKEVLGDKVALGFKLHFIDIFLEELAKVSKGKLSAEAVAIILKPFVRTAAFTKDGRIRFQLSQFFRHLIKQTDVALEYEDKFRAWQRAGFPGGDISLVVPDTDEEDETMDAEEEDSHRDDGKALDPRAGSVHAALPQIKVPVKAVVKLLKQHSNLPDSPVKSKRLILALVRQFKVLGKGEYPFAVKKVATEAPASSKKAIDKAAKKLLKLELKHKQNKAALKKIKKKGKLSAKLLESDEIEADKVKDSTKKRKRKKSKANTPTDNSATTSVKAKKRRISATFDVSIVEESKEKSPIGTKIKSSGSQPELELPCGWIVEPYEKQSESSNAKVDDVCLKNKKEVQQAFNIISTDYTTLNNSSQNVTPTGKIKRKSLRLSLAQQSEQDSDDSSLTHKTPQHECDEKKDKSMPVTLAHLTGEVEITIPDKRKVTPAFFAKAISKAGKPNKTPTPNKLINVECEKLTRSGRRIIFNLERNMAQEKVEYFEQIQRSPQIPFDSKKLPRQSALKAGLPPSPINPFYARQLNLSNSKS